MGIRELRQEASRLGIKYSGLKKAQLEPLVTAALVKSRHGTMAHEPDGTMAHEPVVSEPDNLVKRLTAGSVEETGAFLSTLTKPDARKVRKALRSAGHSAHAGAIRLTRREKQAA